MKIAYETCYKSMAKRKPSLNILSIHSRDGGYMDPSKTEVETGGMNDYVQMFTIIAIFIIVIACINFMNLATARSERRAREVGIRKSVGSENTT
ncbi:MAG: hypothetical protein U5K54_21925 [Cytophagales bacterium]|nr:hypothetical protein [Cytophagales bacterium]